MSDCGVISFLCFFGSPFLRVGRLREGMSRVFLGVWFRARLLA